MASMKRCKFLAQPKIFFFFLRTTGQPWSTKGKIQNPETRTEKAFTLSTIHIRKKTENIFLITKLFINQNHTWNNKNYTGHPLTKACDTKLKSSKEIAYI
jgi:hypothetical protein